MGASVQALYIHRRYNRDRHDDDLVLLQLAKPLPFGPALFQLCLPTKDFSENVLMRPGRPGLTGQNLGENGNSVHQYLAYMSLEDCRNQLNISHPISNKMFCMKSWRAPGKLQSAQQQQIAPETRNEEERRNGRQIQEGTKGQQRGSESQNGTQIQNGQHNFTDIDVSFRSGKSSSKSVDGRCGLLPGTPMTTEWRGTVFLTGVQLSPSSSDCDGGGGGRQGVVFTKLSRYLPWIQQRLDLAEEAEMTPQVSEYPPVH